MFDCPHRRELAKGAIQHCQLVNIGMRATAGMCAACEPQWVDGKPPNADAVRAIVDGIKAAVIGKPQTRREHPILRRVKDPLATVRISVGPPKETPRRPVFRRPIECDHSGKRLRKGPTCQSSVFECEKHGEATCQTCTACPDFLPVESLVPPK